MPVLKRYNSATSTWEEIGGGVNLEGAPIGIVSPYAGTTAPAGWLLCHGQPVSRSYYDKLFEAIGTTFGAGDGVSTFNLPDLRGRTIAGKDNMGGISANRLTGQPGGLNGDSLGAIGGSETHTLTDDQVPNTEVKLGADGVKFTSGTYDVGGIDSGALKLAINTSNTNARVVGSNGSHNNIQPTVVLNYIIKYSPFVAHPSSPIVEATTISFASGWSNFAADHAVKAIRKNDIVYLSGIATKDSGFSAGETILTLGQGFRPNSVLFSGDYGIFRTAHTTSSDDKIGTVNINKSGSTLEGQVQIRFSGVASKWVSLSGISFIAED